MPKFKVLFSFTSSELDLVEIKRLDLSEGAAPSDVYKWLIISKPHQQIIELRFKSMSKSGEDELRSFDEADLVFDHQRAHLNWKNKSLDLKADKASSLEIIDQYLS